jgi:anti-anti-sigma factor
MELDKHKLNGFQIVELKGSMDALTSREVERYFETNLEKGDHRIVLDLKQVDFMSSAGLRVIMTVSQDIRQNGGDLHLASPSPAVGKMLKISGFTSFLKVFPDVQTAMDSFQV